MERVTGRFLKIMCAVGIGQNDIFVHFALSTGGSEIMSARIAAGSFSRIHFALNTSSEQMKFSSIQL